MALNSLLCADVPLRNCSLTHFWFDFLATLFMTALWFKVSLRFRDTVRGSVRVSIGSVGLGFMVKVSVSWLVL